MNCLRNNTMLIDFYELTMANGYFSNGMADTIAYFDMFFRQVPDNGGYVIMAGVAQVIDYLKNLRFSEDDISYLRRQAIFSEDFLNYLSNFKFVCDVWAIAEGTPIFPGEPILTVRGPMIQAQLVETMILLSINHQSLIATKASRMVRAAAGRPVLEFGSRRAHSADAALYGARAAYIGGCAASACVMADTLFGVPAVGTMAHSWIQMFPDEYSAFKAYALQYPDNCVFLVDTYNVLKSGVPNMIKVSEQVLKPLGKRPKGIRIDSGDISYLSKAAREMLDCAGYSDVKITASNSLDEWIIRDLLVQGAKLDSFGIGERLITSRSEPVLGGVYKLCAIEDQNHCVIPKIKLSENVEKITTPHFKQVFRLFDKRSNKAIADVITLHNETIDSSKPYTIFHPLYTWKKKQISDFYAKPLLEPIFSHGQCIIKEQSVSQIRSFCKEQLETLWGEVKRFKNPYTYIVDLSKAMWEEKQRLLEACKL